ncbi:MAG: sulfatase-like hydrolase/transferase [Acidimicrobiales bacterium]
MKPPSTVPVHPASFLLLTLDSCRYDTFEAARAPNLHAIGPVHKAYAPGTFTYSSHAAMFMGFTPGVPQIQQAFTNPKYAKILRVEGGASQGPAAPFMALKGRNVIDGLKQKGYRAFGTGAVAWFDPTRPTSRTLIADFEDFFYPGDTYSLRRQLRFVDAVLEGVDGPVFLFVNVGETHVPYYFEGAPWSRRPSPCRPFAEGNDADECRRRQLGCLEFVDQELAPLLERFAAASVVACADHGDAWGEDGMWEHGIHHPKVLEVPLTYRLVSPPATGWFDSLRRFDSARRFVRAGQP